MSPSPSHSWNVRISWSYDADKTLQKLNIDYHLPTDIQLQVDICNTNRPSWERLQNRLFFSGGNSSVSLLSEMTPYIDKMKWMQLQFHCLGDEVRVQSPVSLIESNTTSICRFNLVPSGNGGYNHIASLLFRDTLGVRKQTG